MLGAAVRMTSACMPLDCPECLCAVSVYEAVLQCLLLSGSLAVNNVKFVAQQLNVGHFVESSLLCRSGQVGCNLSE